METFQSFQWAQESYRNEQKSGCLWFIYRILQSTCNLPTSFQQSLYEVLMVFLSGFLSLECFETSATKWEFIWCIWASYTSETKFEKCTFMQGTIGLLRVRSFFSSLINCIVQKTYIVPTRGKAFSWVYYYFAILVAGIVVFTKDLFKNGFLLPKLAPSNPRQFSSLSLFHFTKIFFTL